MKTNKMIRKFISVALCFMMILTYSVGLINPLYVNANSDVGANPKPVMDIAVNVPSDYPGTFLDFKEELTEKLIAQGLEPGTFRITSTAVSIDTTSMNGWHVYDHYRDAVTYNSAVPADQRAMQPSRITADSHMSGGTNNIANVVNKTTNKFTISAVNNLDRHIYIYQNDNGASNMAFAGYGTKAYTDYMIYPAPSSSTRTFSFNIDASVINTHTLTGFGFLMNAGITAGGDTERVDDDRISGYLLYFNAGSAASGTGAVTIKKLDNVVADALTTEGFSNAPDVSGSSKSFTLGNQKKVRLTVELKKDSLTIQQQAYDASGNLSAVQDVVRDFKIPQFAAETLNGLGPWVGYAGHGCTGFSSIIYTDLEMSYEASAFDALKNVQYYKDAEYKYFINLAGSSNNPGIPDEFNKDGEMNESYFDGINRMNENEIFYISNADDGKIVTDTTKDGLGNVTHQGLGSTNGCIATNSDYVEQMAQFIADNYKNGNHFQKQEIVSDLPLANFYVKNAATEEQLMTIHLKHLQNTNSTVDVALGDQSKPGKSGAKIVEWKYKIYDPNMTVVDSGTVDDPTKVPDYTFDSKSASGRWTFELTVKDADGKESKTFQTYVTAFLDDKAPYIEGENTGKNIATITLTDTGMGIDDDGITFIEDNRGSGVEAYWVTNNENAVPKETDWIYLDQVQHSYSFEYPIKSKDPIVVWVKDECKNVGKKAIFKPIHVLVEDENGDPIDDYYVIGDKPIIVLPEENPDNDNPDEEFSGWVTPGEDPVTPGTTPEPDDNNEIIIRPSFTQDKVKMVYVANQGTFTEHADADNLGFTTPFTVAAGSSIQEKINAQKVVPVRKGYDFTGWKLLKSNALSDAQNSSYINTSNNLDKVETATAVCKVEHGEDGVNHQEKTTYYLIAQWQVKNYTLTLDPNGGTAGRIKKIENIDYGTNVGSLSLPTTGRDVPTKPGCIFMGWSTESNNDLENIFKYAEGQNGTTAAAPTMPEGNLTVYAVWKQDNTKFIVSFDSAGGGAVPDLAYDMSGGRTTYTDSGFSKPSRAGYTFTGWYLGDESYTGTETFAKKENHTFVAHWEANTDTPYYISYFVSTGKKDAQGNLMYQNVAELQQRETGTTETEVSIDENGIPKTIAVGDKTYWYDADNSQNVLSGTITGSPLYLKLYYKGYYNVIGECGEGGTITSAKDVPEGETPTISWSANSGYYVAKVTVDGVVRDDLLYEGTYTLEEGIYADHKVVVDFAKGSGAPVKDVYQIETGLFGCTDGSCTITPTQNVQKGEDVNLEWTIGEGYKVKSILFDGQELMTDSNSLVLKGVQSNHKIIVNVVRAEDSENPKPPTIGGNETDGYCTVTVNRYGGGKDSSVSASTTKIEKGDNYKLTYTAGEGDEVYKLCIDGVDKTYVAEGGTLNVPVNGNVVIDVYFKSQDEAAPDYKEDQDSYIKVNTKVEGGPGIITGGAILKKEESYTVDWTAGLGNTQNPDSEDYSYYEVTSVKVNGEEVPFENPTTGTMDLDTITQDQTVVVKVAPVLYDVGLYKYGEGTISVSRTLFKGQNYNTISATPENGYSIAKIVVDGTTIFDTVEMKAESAELSTETESTPDSNEILDTPAVDNDNIISDDETGTSNENSTPADDEDSESQDGEIMMMALADGEDTPSDDEPGTPQIYYVGQVLSDNLNTVANDELKIFSADVKATAFGMAVKGAQADHKIEVFFTKNPENAPDGAVTPSPTEVVQVVGRTEGYEGGESIFTAGPGLYEKGQKITANWSIPQGYDLVGVKVNGTSVNSRTYYEFGEVLSDQDILVILEKTNTNEPPMGGNLKETMYNIETKIVGGEGTITPSGSVKEGDNKLITWSVEEGYEVKYVMLDGKRVPNSENLARLLVDGYKDHTVEVIVGKAGSSEDGGTTRPPVIPDKPNVDIDTDGDGKPDINIDTDGDGKPDINIDTDGDDKPDVNVDTDDDGKPDVNVDTDGDGKPDINKDTDGDGKPDVDIDTDGDGKPDVNVDTDGDGVPDINIDTDGDGKPDVNIDTDGDGKPDENIKKPEELPGWTDNQGKDKPNKDKTDELPWWIPGTGDQSSLVLWISLMGAALLAVCGLVWTRIRRKSVKEDK